MKPILFIAAILLSSFAIAQPPLEPYRVGIVVKNVERSSAWYEKYLGFATYKKMQFPEYDSLKINFLKLGDFEIELIEKKTSFPIKSVKPNYDLNKEALQGFVKLAFRVNDLKAVYDKVKMSTDANEILGITHDNTFDTDFFIIEDIDGNMLQFIAAKKN